MLMLDLWFRLILRGGFSGFWFQDFDRELVVLLSRWIWRVSFKVRVLLRLHPLRFFVLLASPLLLAILNSHCKVSETLFLFCFWGLHIFEHVWFHAWLHVDIHSTIIFASFSQLYVLALSLLWFYLFIQKYLVILNFCTVIDISNTRNSLLFL